MDLHIKGMPATPRGGGQSNLEGGKNSAQGWRANSRAARGPRPNEVPELNFGKLGDSEDEDSYIPASKGSPCLEPPDSNSTVSWGTPFPTPYALHHHSQQPFPWEEKTVPENLPAPSERYKQKYKQYESELKESYRQHSQNVKEKSKTGTPLEHSPRNEAHAQEDLAIERRKQAVVEQVMVDQLSRAVISDPEQNGTIREKNSLPGLGSAPLRFKNRTLHDTKVKTSSALTENLLSNKLRFDARILSRNGRDACRELIGFFFGFDNSLTVYEYRHFGKNRSNALPFIQKGAYSHQHGRRKGMQYQIRDFYVGANITFATSGQNLPESIRQKPSFTIRITNVGEVPKSMLLATSTGKNQGPTKQELDDRHVFKAIQGMLKERLSKRGVRTLTGLGKYFRNKDTSGDGVLHKTELRQALKEFHLDLPDKDFESLWLILDQNCHGQVDYGEFKWAVIGEMSEYRKAFVRKAYMKLDPNKTGNIAVIDIKKFYCAKRHPKVLSGEATEEQLRSAFVETMQESCRDPSAVSYTEFEDYYEGLSIGIIEDEDFANVLQNSWGI
ncbi:calcyphosin-2 isoform X2 [Polyodon spathula]|uniref:calcyphosin-2 isoform X2 n=1 Tax=Polyodon spathula TaxID=7913 RepID=UPI001B7DE0E3|nr:calcyphosin-2 isoform X2 [Polyodon spathula]